MSETKLVPTNIRADFRLLQRQSGRQCIDCEREAQHDGAHRKGGWSPVWCIDCDEKRIARIDAGFAAISKRFTDPPSPE